MPITFACPRCDKSYSVAEALAGKRVKCKACGQEQTVPSAAPERPPPHPRTARSYAGTPTATSARCRREKVTGTSSTALKQVLHVGA